MYPIVLQLSANAPNPNATQDVYGVSWNHLAKSPGVYTPNPNQVPFDGDMPLAWWEERMWLYDLDYAAANRGKVLDVWLKYAQR